MKKENKFLQKLKKPSAKFLIPFYILTVLFCASSIILITVMKDSNNSFFSFLTYLSFALSAISLGYSIYTIVIYAPIIRENIKNIIMKFPFGKRLLTQYDFRTIIFASISLIINVACVVFNFITAFVTHSYWHASLSVYYSLLVALRGALVFYHKNKSDITDDRQRKLEEIKKYKNCGIVLAITPFSLTVPILQIVFLNRAFIYKGWTVIAFAVFAFYKIIMAIYNFKKARKQTDLTILAVRNVGLADALVSIFSLQTAMLYAFSDKPATIGNVIMGCAVCLLTVSIGIAMAVNANKQLKMTSTPNSNLTNNEINHDNSI